MRTLLLAALLPLLLVACTGQPVDTGEDTDLATDTDTDGGPDGEKLFSRKCASCHGPQALGSAAAPSLEDAMDKTDEELVAIMQNGGAEMAPVDVTDEQGLAIVGWLRELFGS